MLSCLSKIFYYIEYGIRLKIIKYNKSLQHKLNINLIDYKRFGGRYIILGSEDTGKEYDYNDRLLFDGGYLNGKRNRKGKEFVLNG